MTGPVERPDAEVLPAAEQLAYELLAEAEAEVAELRRRLASAEVEKVRMLHTIAGLLGVQS